MGLKNIKNLQIGVKLEKLWPVEHTGVIFLPLCCTALWELVMKFTHWEQLGVQPEDH